MVKRESQKSTSAIILGRREYMHHRCQAAILTKPVAMRDVRLVCLVPCLIEFGPFVACVVW
jgi:hypothetical protein